jgi:hypothetical protein
MSGKGTGAFSPFEWLVALRYLRPRRKEGFISVIAGFSFIGIMLGVATLIIVMAVMNGFRQELFNKMLGLNGHVVVHSLANFTDYDEVADRVRTVPGVKFALPLVEGQVMISTPSTSSGALVRGLRESDLKQLKAIANNIRFGTLDGLDQVPGVALGTRLANELNVKVGDQVSLLTPRGASTALGTAPRVKRYPVAAIFEIGMSEYDASILFMPLNEAQLYFNQSNMVTVLEVVLDSPDDVAKLAPEIVSAGGSSIYVTDWRQRNATRHHAQSMHDTLISRDRQLPRSSFRLNARERPRTISHPHMGSRAASAYLHQCSIAGTGGISARRACLPQHRSLARVHRLADRHRALRARALLPVAAAGRDGQGRNGIGRHHGARPVDPRHALSFLAGLASRSRRSVALRVGPESGQQDVAGAST